MSNVRRRKYRPHMHSAHLVAALLVWLAPLTAQAQVQQERLNRFNDPFFQASKDIIGCPEPLGPRFTQDEQRAQSHHRVERGTSCWLAGACERSNSFAYDKDIGNELAAKAGGQPAFHGSSLWITVQGRAVSIEGCVRDTSVVRELERFARSIPNVQHVSVLVYSAPPAMPPYKTNQGQ
jgi:hypothetical protein